MRKARIMGNYIQYLAEREGVAITDLANTLDCTPLKVYELYKGLIYPTFSQLLRLAGIFGVSVQELIDGDLNEYNQTVVHCVSDFENNENKERILDIIEIYFDISSSIKRKSRE